MHTVHIGNPRTEYMETPMGLDHSSIRFSWQVLRGDIPGQEIPIREQSFDFELCEEDPVFTPMETSQLRVHSVQQRASDNALSYIYDGPQLKSGTRYFWRVRSRMDDGADTAWSETSVFHTGQMKQEEWLAGWISAPGEEHDAAPCFRKEFRCDAEIRKAVLYVCGLGYHELYLNGERIGCGVLEPGQTDYDRRVFYLTHRVEDDLRQGANVIGAVLGNGFFNQDKVWIPGRDYGLPYSPSYGKPRLLLQLELQYAGGAEQYILSDESWRTAPSPILRNNVYAGETFDSRNETAGWEIPGFPADRWKHAVFAEGPGGELKPQLIPSIRVVEQLTVQRHWTAGADEIILDFGQNMTGWLGFRDLSAAAGTSLEFTFAENISRDGFIDTASTGVFATTVEQQDTFIFNGSAGQSWSPRFCWHGFRYASVKTADSALLAQLTPDKFHVDVVHTQLDKSGHFECSDPMLNRLHAMSLWTYRTNFHSLPEDCPARERCGWLADAFIAMETGVYNFDTAALYRKYLEDIDTTRADGIPWDIAPGKRRCGRGISDWAAARILIPWYHYLYYGDLRILTGAYRGMRLVHDYFHSLADRHILSNGRGDWCDPKISTAPHYTVEPLTTTVWYYVCTGILADTCRLLGLPDDSEKYRRMAQKIRSAFQQVFYDEKKRTFGSQTADSLALTFGLVPDNRERETAQSLAADIRQIHDAHMSCGIYGIRYLFDVLSRTGYGDLIAAILAKDDIPSYGNMIARGATTLWEYWGETEVDEARGPRSHNHPMMTGFDTWFYQGLLGIRPHPEAPGFRKAIFQPVFPEWLEYAAGWYDSARGRFSSRWRREQDTGTIIWNITIPPACGADIALESTEDARCRLNGNAIKSSAGTYHREGTGFHVRDLHPGDYEITLY